MEINANILFLGSLSRFQISVSQNIYIDFLRILWKAYEISGSLVTTRYEAPTDNDPTTVYPFRN